MPIFGLVWVASWVGCFFSSSQDLLEVPDYIACVLPASRLTTSGNLRCQPQIALAGISTLKTTSLNSPGFVPSLAQQPLSIATPAQSQSLTAVIPTWLEALGSALMPQSQNQTPPLAAANPSPLRLATRADTNLDRANPLLSNMMGAMQDFLLGFQVIAADTSSPVPVALIRTSQPPTALEEAADLKSGKKRGFWQCAPWKPQRESASATATQERFQIWVKGCLIAELPDQAQAKGIVRNLERALKLPGQNFERLRPAVVKGLPGGKIGNRLLFTVNPKLAERLGRNAELLAIDWVNNLRAALGKSEFSLAEAQTLMYSLQETGDRVEGLASWYGPYFHGRLTATGEIFDQHELTAAHPSLPFGTYLRVTNLDNGKSVVVRINDRGPYFDNRVLDLSHEAARRIGSLQEGVVPIEALVLAPGGTQPELPPENQPQQIATRL